MSRESQDKSRPIHDAASQHLEESLMRAMDEDPRLASGTGAVRADNVLDFIQMTGLTTGDPAAGQIRSTPRVESPDDPISFFEYGVSDVDGSGDPTELVYSELDEDAFRISSDSLEPRPSQSLSELQRIIADIKADAQGVERMPGPASTVPSFQSRSSNRLEPEPAPEENACPPTDEHETSDESRDVVEQAPFVTVDESPNPASSRSTRGLETARELLHELTLANQAAAHTETTFAPLPASDPEPAKQTSGTENLRVSAGTALRGLPRRRRSLPAGRWFARILLAATLGAIAYGAYWLYTNQAQTPRAAYRTAESLIAKDNYAQASNAFLSFARRFPTHPLRAEALFMAGYALQIAPEYGRVHAADADERALMLLQNFIAEYPSHEKVPRAETLIGVLYYRMGRYMDAINLLGDPNRRLRDPGAYVTTLRTLGRSYAGVSQIENARAAFMRAASLEDNMQPDQDYIELAGIYQELADRAATGEERREYLSQAVEQWNYALQVPGLLKSRKEDIKLLRDVVASKLKEPMRESTSAPAEAASSGSRIQRMNRGNQLGGPRESALARGAADSGPPAN